MAAVVKRVATGLVRWSIGLAVVLLVAVAVLVGLSRQVVYEIHSLQSDVADYVSRRTGLVVEFDTLTGSWKGLAPRFRIEQFRVRQSPQHEPALVAQHVDLEVLLLQSLLLLQPRVRLTVDGLAFTLAKHAPISNRRTRDCLRFRLKRNAPVNPPIRLLRITARLLAMGFCNATGSSLPHSSRSTCASRKA